MSTLGKLFIELAADTARLQGDLGKAVGMVEKTAGKFKTAFRFAGGGLLGAAFATAAKQAIDFGDSINKAAIKSGIGNKAMSELAYAAKLADIDIASLSTGLKKMQVSLSEAGTGAKAPTAALAALGLTIADVQKRKPEAQFELLAQRISDLKDPADRTRAAVELFGKAGADLLPLFEQGAAGIAKARAEAEKLGLSFGDDQIKKLSAADDSIKRLDASWKGFATTLTAGVAPALSRILDALSGIDSRSSDSKMNESIRAMEEKVGRLNSGLDFLPADQRAELEASLAQLKAAREALAAKSAQTGTSGGPLGRGRSGSAIGFAAADAATAAEEAAKKASEATLKEEEKLAKEREELFAHTDEEISKEYFDELEERSIRAMEFENEQAEQAKELAEKVAAWREEQSKKLSESAQIFKDAFLNAWDDMVNNGKFKIDELFKYILAEFARRGLAKLFDSMFSGGGLFGGGGLMAGGKMPTGGGPWGWLGKIPGIGGMLGFAGGGRPMAGVPYLVGERGPEVRVDGPGSIIPNHALGGRTVVAHYNIDARGASVDLVKALPKILRDNNRALEALIIGKFQRNAYPGLA